MPIKNFPFIDVGSGDAKPWLLIKIINPETSKSYIQYGLIDTGADECTMPGKVADILGHKLTAGHKKTVMGVGGEVETYSHTTNIEIFDSRQDVIYEIKNVLVDYVPGLAIPLLGVKDFLCLFNLHINYPQKKFSILYPS